MRRASFLRALIALPFSGAALKTIAAMKPKQPEDIYVSDFGTIRYDMNLMESLSEAIYNISPADTPFMTAFKDRV